MNKYKLLPFHCCKLHWNYCEMLKWFHWTCACLLCVMFFHNMINHVFSVDKIHFYLECRYKICVNYYKKKKFKDKNKTKTRFMWSDPTRSDDLVECQKLVYVLEYQLIACFVYCSLGGVLVAWNALHFLALLWCDYTNVEYASAKVISLYALI